MNCPNCNAALLIAERQNVEIDHCPTCRGVWLDRGELDKIIDRANRGDSERKPYKKKRESFLGELFDL